MTQVVIEHKGRDPQRFRRGGDDRHRGNWRELIDQVIGNDQRVVADRFGAPSGFPELPCRLRFASLSEEAERLVRRGGQARIARLAISASIWRSASTYRSISMRSWLASGWYR